MFQKTQTATDLLQRHFQPAPLNQITITERTFPIRVRADLQRAMDSLLLAESQLVHFCGVRKRYNHEGMSFAELLVPDREDPVTFVPPQYEEVHVGDAEPSLEELLFTGGSPNRKLLRAKTGR